MFSKMLFNDFYVEKYVFENILFAGTISLSHYPNSTMNHIHKYSKANKSNLDLLSMESNHCMLPIREQLFKTELLFKEIYNY